MTTRTIQSRLTRASVPFRVLKREWFREDGADMGEYISGIVVDTEDEYFDAAAALGIGNSEAEEKLNSWSCFHLPDLEGYPVEVSYETHFESDDNEPTDSGEFSLANRDPS